MSHSELPRSSWQGQLLHFISRRRHKVYLSCGIAMFLMFTIWICGTLGPYDGFSTRFDTSKRLPASPGEEDSGRGKKSSTNTIQLIPPKLWQILLPQKDTKVVLDAKTLEHTASWLVLNPDYAYTLVGQKGSQEFIESRFANKPKVINVYNSLPNVGMKADLLRYLILHSEGGTYTDIDTVAIKPVDAWVPQNLRDKVRLVVGIEFDRRDGGGWADIPHWLQFCQWTISAAPGHPIFEKMAARVLQSVEDLSLKHGVPVNKLKPTNFEVMNSTGPTAWTDVVFEHLQQYDPSLQTTKDLSFMTEPKLYGDVLVLTIDGFGMGQSHSHSTHDGTIPDAALIRHLFRGSWRGD
ncbi:glycosyltransferase family 32 protein [Mariannaea sp. PMI_226]|nr:glycosyltransferase family 32 protein [Mariannaea sp. PMI_226]